MTLPEGWRELSFKDVADVVYSNVDKKSYPGQKEVVLCNYMDVFRNNYITKNMDFMPSTASDREIEKFTLNKGDVIFTKDSETIEEIAKSAVVVDDLENVVCGYHLGIARPKENVANGVFLANLFSLHPFRKKIMSLANGVTRFGLNMGAFDQIDLSMPPLIEQDKIAEIVISLDAAIEATRAVISQTGRVKNALMTDLLTRGLSGRHKKFKPSPLGDIPEGWEVQKLENVLAKSAYPMRSGPFGSALLKAELVDDGIPFLGIDNVHVEKFVTDYKRFVTHEKFQELQRYQVFPGDVMITIMGTVGRCCIVPPDIGEALSSKHVWVMTLDPDIYMSEILCWQLNHAPWALVQFGRQAQGGTMEAISSKTLRNLLLPVPPIDEQKKITAILEGLNKKLQENNFILDQQINLKAALMQALLTGKVRVPVAENRKYKEVVNG